MTTLTTADTPTEALARFTTDLSLEQIPAHVRERVKDIVLDALASALAGGDASESPRIVSMARSFGQGEDASIVGGLRTTPLGATFANGYLITAVTVCDIHRPSGCHICPEVVAPALAIAESRSASGPELLTAVAAGIEVTARIGVGFDQPAFRSRGWHTPGITGPFGGAAAAGRLLRLNHHEQLFAFGLAGSQSAGSYAQLGSPGIKFQQARGAISGLLSALAAEQGLTSCPEIILHPDGGLYSAYAPGDAQRACNRLGEEWELMRLSLRAWPVAVHLQCVVTGLADLLKEVREADEIEAIDVGISPTAYRMHGNIDWSDRFRARLAAQYVTAIVLLDRACWLEQFTAERVADPAVAEFVADRVTVRAAEDVIDGAADIRCHLRDGRKLERHVALARGEPDNPLSREEIVAKFRRASESLLEADQVADAIEIVSRLEELDDVRRLMSCLRPKR